MDPRRLITFREVAHERSFSRAATNLSITQPSVSHQIGMLETEIGVRLFDRGRGGLRLTHAGEVLLEHADHISWRLELANAQIAGIAGARRDHVRVGAFPTSLAGYLPAAVARLIETGSDVEVQLVEVTPSKLEPRLLSGEFDIAISYGDGAGERAEIAGVTRIDLLQDTFLMAMSRDHPLAGSTDPVELTAFADDDWVLPSTDGYLIQVCRDAGFEPRVASVTYDPLASRGLISRGNAVGWCPTLLAHDMEGLALRPITAEMPRRDVFALLPPGEPHPRAHAVLRALTDTAPAFGISSAPPAYRIAIAPRNQ